jgi:hypothetical protein
LVFALPIVTLTLLKRLFRLMPRLIARQALPERMVQLVSHWRFECPPQAIFFLCQF